MRLVLAVFVFTTPCLGNGVRDMTAWRRFAGEPSLRPLFLDTTPVAERVDAYAAILQMRLRLAARLREIAEMENALADLAPGAREIMSARAEAFRDAAELVLRWDSGCAICRPSLPFRTDGSFTE